MENIKKYSKEELNKIGNAFSESQFAKNKLERAKKAIEKLRPQLERKLGIIFESNIEK